MSDIERDESVQEETPRSGKLDRKTLLVLATFLIGFVLLIAMNMK